MSEHHFAVIMAGGGGTRLWPVSRRGTPKQTLRLFDDRSLFQLAVERLDGFISAENTYVVTSAELVDQLHEQKPQLDRANFLIEPQPRGTAAVVAMAAAALLKKDPNAVLAVLTADHLIGNIQRFHQSLSSAYSLAEQGYIVTLGITPLFAATGYGYVERGTKLGEFTGLTGYKVVNFIEKPHQERADELIKNVTCSWNSGMFICRADVVWQEFNKLMPDLYNNLNAGLLYLNHDHLNPAFVETWMKIKPETIDYGIMEKTPLAAVIPVADLDWKDIGSWDSFFDVIQADENGNIILQSQNTGIDTTNTLIFSTQPDKLVVSLGVKNLIIIHTPDAVLVCQRGESQRVKELVNYLDQHHYTLFL